MNLIPFRLKLLGLGLSLLATAVLVSCSAIQTSLPTESSSTTAAPNDAAPYPVETSTTAELSAGVITIAGTVLSGGDQTPSGLQDAPRTYVYQVQLEDGAQIDVVYTAYPPSLATDQHPVTLEFYAGQIQIGDRLEAQGEYDPAAQTLTVAQTGDFIRTFAAEHAYP